MPYAENTSVSVSKSWEEIERTLERYGATSFIRGWDQQKAFLAFVLKGKQVRLFVPLPDKALFTKTPTGKERTSQQAINEAYEQATRQRMRALALVVKAKLEAVEAGISTFEDEFLSHIVLPSGETAGQWLIPQITQAYQSGHMPPLLPEGKS